MPSTPFGLAACGTAPRDFDHLSPGREICPFRKPVETMQQLCRSGLGDRPAGFADEECDRLTGFMPMLAGEERGARGEPMDQPGFEQEIERPGGRDWRRHL